MALSFRAFVQQLRRQGGEELTRHPRCACGAEVPARLWDAHRKHCTALNDPPDDT